jgi:porphobilinogen deaminase
MIPGTPTPRLVEGTVDEALAGLVAGEHDALLLPGALMIAVDQRDRIDALLDAEAFPPAPGLGAMGLVVRADDDAAAELAYTFQHRPSFDRVRAERAFAAGLGDLAVGALATIDDEGDLSCSARSSRRRHHAARHDLGRRQGRRGARQRARQGRPRAARRARHLRAGRVRRSGPRRARSPCVSAALAASSSARASASTRSTSCRAPARSGRA